MRLGGDSIEFRNVTGVGQWDGKPVYGDPFTLSRVNVQPLSVSESTESFTDVGTDLKQVWCPPTDEARSISITSMATYEGRTYQVAGDPQPWRSLGGRLLFVLVRLEAIK